MSECSEKLDGAENFLRCSTPTGEDCESEKLTFSTTIASSKAAVDVLKSLFNKLQESDTSIQDHTQLESSVQGNFGQNEAVIWSLECVACLFVVCATRWDMIKSRAMEKRRRLKHNYQLWHQFVTDVRCLRDWIVQCHSSYSSLEEANSANESSLAFSGNYAAEQLLKKLLVQSDCDERKLVSLHQLEHLIMSHRVSFWKRVEVA